MLAEIALDRVEIPDGRRAIDPDAVARLKNSIAVVGLQHPITVAKRDGGYRRIARRRPHRDPDVAEIPRRIGIRVCRTRRTGCLNA
jgi:hypothetical protein